MVHTSYLPDWRLPSSWWTILYIPAACQICANNVFGGILKVTEYIKEFDKSLFLDSVNSFLRFQPERIWKIMIFSAPSVSCPFLSHSSSPSVWYWDLYFFSSEIATLEQMFPPFPGGRGFCRTKQFLSDRNTTCSVRLNRESACRRIAARRLRRAGSFEVRFFLCRIPTVQKYSVLIRCKAVACLTCNDSWCHVVPTRLKDGYGVVLLSYFWASDKDMSFFRGIMSILFHRYDIFLCLYVGETVCQYVRRKREWYDNGKKCHRHRSGWWQDSDGIRAWAVIPLPGSDIVALFPKRQGVSRPQGNPPLP